MPECGSQVVLCDLPVRFDTYRGCGHGCTYCFARKKRSDPSAVRPGEGVKALRDWIAGKRATETNWCDWRMPLHWGGMSDPFQPAEVEHRRSLACLEIFADSGYPVVISTKGTLLGTAAYRDRLKACDAAVQVSMVSPRLNAQEPGAPPFAKRLRLLERLSSCVKRLIVRCQPFMPRLLADVLRYLPRYGAAGVHGVTVEGLKCSRATAGMVRLGTDHVYPADVLRRDFAEIRDGCHALGLKFYGAENRFRLMGDSTCCCGVDDLPGFRVNHANLNRTAAGLPIRYTKRMREVGTAGAFKALCQDAVSTPALRGMSYAECMNIVAGVPVYRRIMGFDGAAPVRGRAGKAAPRAIGVSQPAGRGQRRGEYGRGARSAKFVAGGRPSGTRASLPKAGDKVAQPLGSPRGAMVREAVRDAVRETIASAQTRPAERHGGLCNVRL